MAAYRRVYDSRHLQAGCQEPGSAAEPCGNRVWAAFFIEIDDSCIDCIQQLAPRIMLQYIA